MEEAFLFNMLNLFKISSVQFSPWMDRAVGGNMRDDSAEILEILAPDSARESWFFMVLSFIQVEKKYI